jgi:MinD superfamily P-loop ATPase
VDEGRCDGCGKCEQSCPFGAARVDGTSAVLWEKCMGCGVCEGQCPQKAVTLVRDERKGIPFDVRVIAEDQEGRNIQQ